MNQYLARVLIAGTCIIASVGAMAQSPPSTTDHPKAIGVSQATADEANQKAIQNGSTATVVRTGPSATEKASDAMSSSKDKMTNVKNKAKAKAHTDADK